MDSDKGLIVLLMGALSTVYFAEVNIPDLDHFRYSQPGDVTLAVFMDLHEFSSEGYCSDKVAAVNILRVEAILFAVQQINQIDDLLPNVTLGVAVFDSCKKDTTALASAIQLIPASDGSATGVNPFLSRSANGTRSGVAVKGEGIYDVVGVLGAGFSRQAVMVAGFLGLFRIPVLSQWASSDDLSDEARFPYFLRLIPPDLYQTEAMVDIASYFNWTYVSLIYGEGSYGENAARRIEAMVKERGMCIAVNKRISSAADDIEFQETVKSLSENKEARAVLIVIEHFNLKRLFKVVHDEGLADYFLWIGSEAFASIVGSDTATLVKEVVRGGFYLNSPLGEVEGLMDYWKNITVETKPPRPWIKPFWEQYLNCNLSSNKSMPCLQMSMAGKAEDLHQNLPSKDIDGVYVYAHALHNIISDNCPQAFIKKNIPKDCTRGDKLFTYLKEVSIEGYAEEIIAFDEKGDMLGSYDILELQRQGDGFLNKLVGRWNRMDGQVVLDMDSVVWTDSPHSERVPPSRCSEPCGFREYVIYSDVPCCWECQPCRQNEIIQPNTSLCVECDTLTWPDPDSETTCSPIAPTYLHLTSDDWISLVLASLAMIVCCATLVAIAYIFWYRRHKLIKATARELSSAILIGLLLAGLTVFAYLVRPTSVVCILRDAAFHLTTHLLYAPLLIKTVRIYRIFQSGQQGNARVRFTSIGMQLIFLSLSFVGEMLVIFLGILLWPSKTTQAMPLIRVPYVELFCSQPLPGFLLPLLPNLLIVLSCAVIGFLSRKLPENFNESWFIFVSVSTTMFMWLVFLPTYFLAFYASHKTALLALSLVLNCSITIGCQFVPRYYAVQFVGVERMAVASSLVHNTTSVAPTSTIDRSVCQ